MKGIRHAQSWICPSLKFSEIHKDISAPSKIPKDSPAVNKPFASPIFLSGTCSDTKVHAAGISPPIAIPCTTRMSNKSSGAKYPIFSKVGNIPINRVGSAISKIESENNFLRPTKSPKWAMTTPPKGLKK
ncbi:Uncharacterised protein [Acinetobacter baumannii]|nr:Uncharacterised protein [Acinetobacter baumannii]SSU29182.1 Uncharacterised protein [Acinetobacter baumannii]SSU49412.1 Uncharacterised protein [Acinetobacter baumannii]